MSHATQSLFAAALEGLLDETGLFSRAEWGEVLGVSQPAISQWVKDRTIPRADNLSMILLTLERSSEIPTGPLDNFRKIAELPAIEVSPHGRRMLPTVDAYMTRPANSDLASDLAKLSPEAQATLLEKRFPPMHGSSSLDPWIEPIAASSSAGSSQSTLRQQSPSIASVGHYGLGKLVWSQASSVPESRTPYFTPTFRIHRANRPEEPIGAAVRWDEIAQNSIRLVVHGEPGCGKTSLLSHLLRAVTNREGVPVDAWGDRFPVFVPLHRMPPVRNVEELWNVLGDAIPSARRDRILLLLDGFDEVPMNRREGLADALSGFSANCPDTAVVVTSRPTHDVRQLQHFTHCSLQPPSDSRLLALAYKEVSTVLAGSEEQWYDSILRIGSCFRERPDVFHAVRNPLLLTYAARQFARTTLTSCHDTDLLDSCLGLLLERWDQEKEVERPRSRWTSSSPRAFSQWFGGLCYRSLVHQEADFAYEQVARWFADDPDRTPDEEDLRSVSELTGIIQPSTDSRWRFSHKIFQEYLAARYIIEGSCDIREYLKGSLDKPWISSVLRFACSITNDSTPLLCLVLDTPTCNRSGQILTLADMIAQQIRASRDVIDKSCDHIAMGLEDYFDGWGVATTEEECGVFPEPKWRLAARNEKKKPDSIGFGKQVLHTVKAVHRARSSPARTSLANRLARSPNEVVRGLGESMSVAGYMEGRSFSRGERELFTAEVCEI